MPVVTRKEVQDGVEVMVWDEADNAASFHEGSSTPGQGGTVVISGSQNGQGEVFRNLADLTKGATITLYAGDQSFEYSVEQVLLLPQEYISPQKRQENEKWLQDNGTERLILISYWPYEKSTHRVLWWPSR